MSERVLVPVDGREMSNRGLDEVIRRDAADKLGGDAEPILPCASVPVLWGIRSQAVSRIPHAPGVRGEEPRAPAMAQ